MQEEARVENFVKETKTADWLTSDEAVRVVYGVVGLLVIAIVVSLIQFSAKGICCGDYDGYYHIRWSQMMWENFSHGKWLPSFDALPFTTLNAQSYADQHFLFHLLQIPFLWFFEPIMAAKVSAIVFSTTAIFACYWLILRYKLDYPLVWLLALLACANPFLYRMGMAKAPPLAIIFMIIGVYLLFERRYVWLFPLMFFFVWTYSLFPTLFIAAVIWTVIIAWNEARLEWRPIALTLAGMLAGNIINPYFPRNFWLLYEHFVTKIGGTGTFSVAVGGEWYPYETAQLLTLAPITLIAMFIGYILFNPKEKTLAEKPLFLLLFSTFLLIWTLQSKRFMEYFPPFAILFAAFTFQSFITSSLSEAFQLPEEFRRDLDPYLDTPKKNEAESKRDWWQGAMAFAIGVILFFVLTGTLFNFPFRYLPAFAERKGLTQELADDAPPTKYERGLNWVNQNVPEGQVIFNTDWDDFPKLFFHSPHHAFVTGLDPTYLYKKNPELWKFADDISLGKVDDPAPILREKFNVTYVFAKNGHDDFYAKAMESGWFDKVYDDDECFILKMRDQKGEPPPEAKPEESKAANKDEELTPEEMKAAENDNDNENVDEDEENAANTK